MTNEILTYSGPNLGCMLGTAYQTLLSELTDSLDRKGLDITTSEYLVMRALYSNDGLQQCEIAALLGKDKGAISRCVKNLENKNLVTTEVVSHKCLRVYVSEKGRLIQPSVMAVADERHKALTSMLTHHEMETFVSVLKRIINNH